MGHNYYSQDYEDNNEQRLQYFDEQFKSLANEVAMAKGITLSAYLSQITNLTTFKAVLNEVFSQDVSLSNYILGMTSRDFSLFFDRQIIQDIVSANIREEPEKIQQRVIPSFDVKQVKKETRSYFKASYTDKKSGRTRQTIAYKTEVTVRGKAQVRYRDSKGRWASKNG